MLTWQQLVMLPAEQLARQDIAAMSLACAVGVPGAESMDVPACMHRLDFFARRVQQEVNAEWRQFRRNRAEYHNSEAYFVTLILITVLQRDCGIHYNPLKIPAEAAFDAADSFIFGVLQTGAGTCATLPPVYVAVGRRLGFPLKMVRCRGKNASHVFARWDDGRERFNIEASGVGLSCPPDDYFRTGRYELTPEIERDGCYLRSQLPREELAGFLSDRLWCLRDAGHYRDAAEAAAWACELVPENKLMTTTLNLILNDWGRLVDERKPPKFPPLDLFTKSKRFRCISERNEFDMLGLAAIENLLNDPSHEEQIWAPLRKGQKPTFLPEKGVARFDPNGCTITLTGKKAL